MLDPPCEFHAFFRPRLRLLKLHILIAAKRWQVLAAGVSPWIHGDIVETSPGGATHSNVQACVAPSGLSFRNPCRISGLTHRAVSCRPFGTRKVQLQKLRPGTECPRSSASFVQSRALRERVTWCETPDALFPGDRIVNRLSLNSWPLALNSGML